MNFLAHIALTSHDADAMLGALLGDFASRSEAALLPAAVQREIHLHRLVDTFTDQHPEVLAMKAGFASPARRYAGILLDIYFDLLLTRHWERWYPQSRTVMIADFYQHLQYREALLPPRLQSLLPRMVQEDWLASYGHWAGLERAVRRTASRLSRHGEHLIAGLPHLQAQDSVLEQGFLRFYPELIQHTETQRQRLLITSP